MPHETWQKLFLPRRRLIGTPRAFSPANADKAGRRWRSRAQVGAEARLSLAKAAESFGLGRVATTKRRP